MPYLSVSSPSIANTMSTRMHYHTTLTATWISDYVYKLVFKIIREEAQTADEAANNVKEGWHVERSHKYRFIYYNKNENLVDSGEVSLYGTTVSVPLIGPAGKAGWSVRCGTVFEKTIETCKNPAKRKVIAMYTGTVDNTSKGGTIETPVFWSPSSNIAEAPTLLDGPNTYVRRNGVWTRAKDIFVRSGGQWVMVPTGDMSIRTGNTWKS
nr:MAG TPA: hypothetical protein [Caudoviricetes sp.]